VEDCVSKTQLRTLAILLCVISAGAFSGASFAQKSTVSPELRTGMWRGRPVTYALKNGQAIYEGDIILDHVQPMPAAPDEEGAHPLSIGVAYPQSLWPQVGGVYQVPYVITSDGGDANLAPAINSFNTTFTGLIQWVTRTSQTNYVNIDLNSADQTGECEATEGDANIGSQPMTGSGTCTLATLLHEMGHEIGLYHEQSRTDRNTYVTVNYQNLILASRFNFDIIQDNVQNLTLYDYASVMEYPPFSFSRNGGPAIESIPPGMPLSNSAGYSAADIEGIERLYGAPPASVTVTSNPPGLQVIVDGSMITTPEVFSWALNSVHTLNVPTGVQNLSGDIVNSSVPTTFSYTYGRWNDNTAASHSITVTPGNGEVAFPATSPQVATYTANFIQVVPYTAAVFGGTGSVSPSPAPQSYGVSGGAFFVARQQETLTASPTGSSQFYEFNNANFWLPGGLGANPKTFYVPDTGLGVNVTAEFAPAGTVYTVDVSPDAFSSNLYAYVDGTFWYVPKNFSPSYDSTWTVGSDHTVNVDTYEYPYSSNSRYAYTSWSDGGAQSHTVVLPGSGTSYIATLTPQFFAADNFNYPPCGGNAVLTPASPTDDGFYPTGQSLTYTATPDATWTFAGWTYSLTGTTNPDNLTTTDETLVFANFNTTNTPLTLSSISPSTAASGGPAFTLTLNGTGFTTGSLVSANGVFLTPTFISSTEMTVSVPATDITTPVNFQVYVENFPAGWTGCANFGYQPFFVFQSTVPFITPSPTSLTFASQAVGTTSTSQPITVTNTGGGSTTVSIAPSGDFGESNTCPTTLNAGANCTINVTFTPTVTGTRTGSITITDAASNSPQVVALSGTGAAATVKITVTPTKLAFGSVAVGVTSASKPATVKNTGTGSTTISFATSGDFAESGTTCGSTLAGGASCTVSVTFTPEATGALTGTLSVTDQASNSPQKVSLSGTGTAAAATITLSPATLTFTSTTVGSTSAGSMITVKNTGSASTAISFTASGDFGETGTCGTTLAAGASCVVTVTFTPTVTGSVSGALTVIDNASNSPQIASLTGTGAVPVTFTPTSLAFGNVAVGKTSAAKTVTLKNAQAKALSFSFAASGNYAAVGGTTNPCGTSLAAGTSCTVSVTFTPTATATIDGALTISYNSAYSPLDVKLSGTGTGGSASPLTLTPASLAFSSQAVGTASAAKTVTVQNTSASSVTISGIAASGNFTAAGSGAAPCGGALAATASCTFSVTFVPSVTGAITGSAVISDNASVSQQVENLTGTAVQPVTIAPTSLTFTGQAVGTTSPAQTLTVTNNASTALSLTGYFGSGDFSVSPGGTSPCGSSIPANGSCTLSVTFTPESTGSIKGAATITDGASTSPQTVKLTGTGG
jgi:hypothetical protein